LDDKITLFFSSDHKLGVQEFRKYIEFIKEPPVHFAACLKDIAHCMIICKEGATSGVTNEMNLPEIRSIQVEIFSYKNLFRNITHHQKYRKHTVCTPEEKEQILRRYNAKESEMPILQWKDPVRKYFHFAPGTLIRIERAIGTGAPFIYYRIVSKPQ
jgi:DNA-directed RNA polymerase subunit H (RpoH/RPB5)